MMAKLEFKLPDEKSDLLLALNAQKILIVLTELDHYLRNKIKYGELPEEYREIYEEIRNVLHNNSDGVMDLLI